MLVAWQLLAFTGCALLGLVPNVEVYCRLDVPVAAISRPAPVTAEVPPPPVFTSSDH